MVASDGPTLEYRLEIAQALDLLRAESDAPGIADVFAHFEGIGR